MNSHKEEKEVSSTPLVVGHRGAMGHETENTLASILKAIEMKVDMIEMDIFQIKDGTIVVFHDERLERLSNGFGNIEHCNLSEVKQLVIKEKHKIPTLQEVLDISDNGVSLNIELKNAGIAENLDAMLRHYVAEKGWIWSNFVISSFNWEELIALRKINAEVPIAILTTESQSPIEALATAKAFNFIAINGYHTTLTTENVSQIHQEGYKVFAWTVNKPEDIQRMKLLGVDAIVSDYPERVRQSCTM